MACPRGLLVILCLCLASPARSQIPRAEQRRREKEIEASEEKQALETKALSRPGQAAGKPGALRLQHGGMVIAVAFSPDGKTIACGGWDNLVHLWDVRSGKHLRELRGHTNAIFTLAFAPDGKLLASGGQDNLIHLWDAQSGKEVNKLAGHPQAVSRIAFAPDGKTLASGGYDGTIRLWQVATAKELRQFTVSRHGINPVAFSPDGKFLVAGDEQGARPNGVATSTLHFWEVGGVGVQHRTVANFTGLGALAFSPDGKTLALGGSSLRLLEVATGKDRRPFTNPPETVWALALSPDGRTIATGSPDKSIRLWEVATGRERRLIAGHGAGVAMVVFSPDGKTLASASHDKTVGLWDVSGSTSPPLARRSLAPAELEKLWEDLSSADAVRAFEAIGVLASAPGQTLPFLKERVRPGPAIDPQAQRLAQLVADLDDDRYAVREKASAELEKLGEQAGPILRKALDEPLSLEARRRVERLLEKGVESGLPSDRRQGERALEVLEQIGTADARKILENLATGPADAILTQHAKESLARLAKKLPDRP